MSNLSLEPSQKPRRRRAGPIVIGILFFLAACGVSLDFLTEQFGEESSVEQASVHTVNPKLNLPTVSANPTEMPSRSLAAPTGASSDGAGERKVAGTADPFIDDMSMVGPESLTGRSDSTLPLSNPWPNEGHHPRKQAASTNTGIDPADEPFEMARGKTRAPAQFDYETAPEDLKISTEPSKWRGVPQVLPSPMYVSQLKEKRSLDIRGGGWVMIDVNKSQITNVELFKAAPKASGERRVIEAKYADGNAIVNPNSAGFAIVRGVPGLLPGGFEVFENPPCLVRFSNANEEETCDVIVRGNRARFKFTPPVLPAEGPAPDFIFSDVFFETGRGTWKKIISFNESFHPLGDPNRDGYPDFLVESVTGYDESGVQVLLMSYAHDDIVEYVPYTTRFKGH
ncbi:hypothetical protein BH10BDE1_BH10BDE1_26380 [soil metagenome]